MAEPSAVLNNDIAIAYRPRTQDWLSLIPREPSTSPPQPSALSLHSTTKAPTVLQPPRYGVNKWPEGMGVSSRVEAEETANRRATELRPCRRQGPSSQSQRPRPKLRPQAGPEGPREPTSLSTLLSIAPHRPAPAVKLHRLRSPFLCFMPRYCTRSASGFYSVADLGSRA